MKKGEPICHQIPYTTLQRDLDVVKMSWKELYWDSVAARGVSSMAERLVCNEEVIGSSPIHSTKCFRV
jgi:hypothetical protein